MISWTHGQAVLKSSRSGVPTLMSQDGRPPFLLLPRSKDSQRFHSDTAPVIAAFAALEHLSVQLSPPRNSTPYPLSVRPRASPPQPSSRLAPPPKKHLFRDQTSDPGGRVEQLLWKDAF